jgi:hypothetical protein
VTGDLLREASQEPLASCDTAFCCLLQLGGQGDSNQTGAGHCRNLVNGETLSISRLIELTGDLGLKAEHARLDWQRLQALGFSQPLVALLKNTNVIVLTGSGRGVASEVAVWDPLNPFGEILFVPREDFERAWTGHVLIITTSPFNVAATSPSLDFCWFTSAGLELLGKMSAKGQNPKSPVQKLENAGTRPKATARRTPWQTDRAIARAVRGKLGLARVANVQMQPDPAEGAQPSTPASSRSAADQWLSPLVRLCITVGGILAAACIGAVLLRNSATGPFTAAITLVKEVWAVAPKRGWPTDHRIASVTRTGSAPIPAAPSSTSDDGRSLAALSTARADGGSLAAPPAVPAIVHGLAAPSAKLLAPPAIPAAVRSLAAPSGELPAPPATRADGGSLAAPPATPATIPGLAAPSAEPLAPPVEPAVPTLTRPPTAPPHEPDGPAPGSELGLATPAKASPDETAAPLPTAGSRLSAEDMGALLARGDTLLSVGDVVSARLFYERAVDGGGGLAAIRLGETFDPLFLDRVHLRDVRGDPGAALFWYRRARDLGASDAEVLLKALEGK